jgi:CDP-diacylglycerol---glycerol-3-phosphate 3-phosphatidyltransferase
MRMRTGSTVKPSSTSSYERQPPLGEQLLTWANLATTVRLVFGLLAFGVALVERSEMWNYIGLAIYWSLDIVDGFLARRLKQETLFGAQYDILADRIQVAFFYLIYASFYPEKILVITLFLLQFMVFDHFLSNQFIRWKIISPNYFHRVDRVIFNLLWSPLAKAANTGLVTILIIVTPWIWPPLVVTVALIGVRVYCALRVMSLPTPILAEPLTMSELEDALSVSASRAVMSPGSAAVMASEPG